MYPDEFKELVKGINEKRDERLKFIDKITGEIKKELKRQHVDGELSGRAKHLYSIYKKMQRDNKTLEQIYDLFALRILVNSIKDCYAALGVVHELYTPMPGRFKDYIAVPKPNMYQSLHTTLLGKEGIPFEVQIRTYNMHQVAEFGIAAHWAYKEKSFFSGKKQSVKVTEDKLSWLRESLEWQKDMQDPDEFLATLKTELVEDEVYVFTPKGDIKTLPKGSTPIDFAYSIHAEIGNKMVGAKINSKMMPIITKLNNGDIVDIITNDNSKGPSRDWLNFVVSSSAKTRIQQFFKKRDRQENVEKGKTLIEKEVKKLGIPFDKLFDEKYYKKLLTKYAFKNLDDMYSSVGFGSITSNRVISRVLEEYRKDNKEEDFEEQLKELSKDNRPHTNDKTGIIVKGIDNCLIRLARCCHPVAGDEIIGYVSKGNGVTVHRKNCKNITEFLDDENRIIDVAWDIEKAEQASYNVHLMVFANDRDGLLADIISVIALSNANLTAVNAKANKEKIGTVDLTMEVKNLDDLHKVERDIRKVDSVYDVKRKK